MRFALRERAGRLTAHTSAYPITYVNQMHPKDHMIRTELKRGRRAHIRIHTSTLYPTELSYACLCSQGSPAAFSDTQIQRPTRCMHTMGNGKGPEQNVCARVCVCIHRDWIRTYDILDLVGSSFSRSSHWEKCFSVFT